MEKDLKITIGWLYPDLMSTYGDRGNIIGLQKRAKWRDISAEVKKISIDSENKDITDCNLLFMGGAQDKQQEIVNKDLQKEKGRFLIRAIENNVPALFVCGAYQFMGKYYKTANGKKLEGLSLFDLFTESPSINVKRLIGNIVIQPNIEFQNVTVKMVGFENHGGRTYLSDKKQAFARVIKGYGNNGEDGTEGIIYKNAIGTYLHGPILPKNPELADWLIEKALEVKYKRKILLDKLDDNLEYKAKELVINKI